MPNLLYGGDLHAHEEDVRSMRRPFSESGSSSEVYPRKLYERAGAKEKMKCKQCSKDILYTLSGLRAFCSEACRREYRRAYLRHAKRTERLSMDVNKKGGYVNTYLADVNKSEPLSKPFYEGQNRGLGLLEPSEQKNASKALKIDYDSFGGKDWYELAKSECCNFQVREKEGVCITLHEPYYLFKAKCSDCNLGRALRNRL